MQSYFEDKNEVVFLVPKPIKDGSFERFLIEILETVEAYVTPIANGVSRGDIVEYLFIPRYQKLDLTQYLKLKRYVADTDEFLSIFLKYATDEADTAEGVEVVISNIVEKGVALEAKVIAAIQAVQTNEIGLVRADGIKFKRVTYSAKTGKIRHLKQV